MHIPTSTYRLQFNVDFQLKQASYILPYLSNLGISDIYSSPLTCAIPGSQHGYDVINPRLLNPEIGHFKNLKKFVESLHRHHLSLLLDFVPNHMAADPLNKWWKDVLKKGNRSLYSKFFDIHWRDKKNFFYRRFFDINELVCLRIEDPTVFNAVHSLVWNLIVIKLIDGLRIDHIDGLHDPTIYLSKLNKKIHKLTGHPIYLIVEKILGFDERMPPQWSVDGTTGYEFLNAVNAIYIDKKNYKTLVDNYHIFTGLDYRWSEIRYRSKKQVIQTLFQAETDRLVDSLIKIAKQDQVASQCFRQDFKVIIEEFTALFPIYRTYINSKNIHKDDQKYLKKTIQLIKKRLGSQYRIARLFFEKIILLKFPSKSSQFKKSLTWIMEWQQYSGPIMAKGFEDTACYVYNPLISLNEVGSDPNMEKNYGNIHVFHQFLKKRQRLTPHSLNATSTHDTKRSEDVRARVNILSELADEWILHLKKWSKQLQAPDPNTEILLYQTLLGAWPISIERIKSFMIKAVREAKTNTSWQEPNHNYEKAVLFFIDSAFSNKEFFNSFLSFQKKMALHGALNSLSQLLIKMTAPGVPDFYQGCELWNLNLVDPDNREPVDFSVPELFLNQFLKATPHSAEILKDLCRHWSDGRIKLFLTYLTLQFRRENSLIFQHGRYIPIQAAGQHKLCLFSFCRYFHKNWLITVVPRMTTRLTRSLKFPIGENIWGNTELILPKTLPLHWKNIYTNEIISRNKNNKLPMNSVFKKFPVALLIAES